MASTDQHLGEKKDEDEKKSDRGTVKKKRNQKEQVQLRCQQWIANHQKCRNNNERKFEQKNDGGAGR